MNPPELDLEAIKGWGFPRSKEEAFRLIQALEQAWEENQRLRQLLEASAAKDQPGATPKENP